jgi:hypothetical protein
VRSAAVRFVVIGFMCITYSLIICASLIGTGCSWSQHTLITPGFGVRLCPPTVTGRLLELEDMVQDKACRWEREFVTLLCDHVHFFQRKDGCSSSQHTLVPPVS